MALNLSDSIVADKCPVCGRRQYAPPMMELGMRCVRCLLGGKEVA